MRIKKSVRHKPDAFFISPKRSPDGQIQGCRLGVQNIYPRPKKTKPSFPDFDDIAYIRMAEPCIHD
jgi:hypothetical protein